MKKKLLVFHPALAPYRIDFFNRLSDEFDALFYFEADNVKDQNFDQKHLRRISKFNFNLLKSGLEIGNKNLRFAIFKILNKYNPDIVLCSEYSPTTILTLLKKMLGGRFKLYIISDDSIDLSEKRKGLRKFIRNFASKRIDGIFFPSEQVCQWYNKNVNPATIAASLPIIHDNSIFRDNLSALLPAKKNDCLQGVLADDYVFLFVGRHVKVKNINSIIEVYSDLQTSKDSILIIVGEGPETQSLIKMADQSPSSQRIHFVGRHEGDDLYKWYLRADTLILASYYEPYGAVVNEALLSGCKVICSDKAGAAQLISDKNGVTYNPDDLNALKSAMLTLKKEGKTSNQKHVLRTDLMPFQLSDKLNRVIDVLKS